jgi:integrase
MLKTFYRWLNEEEYLSLPEKKLDKIQIPRRTSRKTANDLLTVTEISQMMNACRTSRERAFLSTLYEGGFRIGEIGQMVWNDLKFDGTVLSSMSTSRLEKTGISDWSWPGNT